MRAAAALGNEISALESQVAGAAAARSASGERLAELDQHARTLVAANWTSCDGRRAELAASRRTSRPSGWPPPKTRLAAMPPSKQPRRQTSWPSCGSATAAPAERAARAGRTGAAPRGAQRGREGSAGRAAKPRRRARFAHVRGLVADLFHVSVEAAPLVEVALGERRSTWSSVRGDELHGGTLAEQAAELRGRVGFVWLDADRRPTPPAASSTWTAGRACWAGPTEFVRDRSRTSSRWPARLLGRTWIVGNAGARAGLGRADRPPA